MNENKEDGLDVVGLESMIARLRVFTKENVLVVGLGGLGLVLAVVGMWQYIVPSKPTVEIVKNEIKAEESSSLYVDVEGAVENPGVYEVSEDARVGHALVSAGGLSSAADRNWVSRFVNLAAPITDGMKIYIPASGEDIVKTVGVANPGNILGTAGSSQVNINTASVSELDGLWGIGQARASDIVANRPYGSVDELLTKANIPQNVYDRNKDKVSVY